MSPLMMLCLIGLASILCQWGAFRLKIPAILPLLLTGLLLGPATGILNPDLLLGDILFPLVSVAVAIILFEGSLTLKFSSLQGQSAMVRNLVIHGMLITFAIATLSAHWLLELTLPVAALLGALVVVTGPTVIAPLLRSIRATPKVATILHWEGILIDPIGALLAVLVYEFLNASQGAALSHALTTFGLTVALGLVAGIVAGYLLAQALKHRVFPHYLQTVAVLTLMLAAFGVSNELMHESGLLTVTVMGIWLANAKDVELEEILEFKETLTILLISALFILLAARLDQSAFAVIDLSTVVWLLVLLLIARPIAVFVCGLGTDLSIKEQLLIGWIAPRGIVAAAISALFALKLEFLGIAGADRLVAVVFMVIISTVVLQSVVTPLLVKWLGLQAPDKNGYLIYGSSLLAQAIADTLTKRDIPVVLTDTNWDNISAARMKGLSVYWGNPVSEHAEAQLDLSLIRRLLVLSPYRRANTEVAFHYQDLLGNEEVYRLPESQRDDSPRKQSRDKHQRLFGDYSYAKLEQQMREGAQIRTTKLSDSFTWEHYQQQHPTALPLFLVTNKGKVTVVTGELAKVPEQDWEVIALHPEADGDAN
ncbi:cation:proton antiporter [Ferrimonas lipolytica]|uniref:Sodium:proton antiporter n=1 Tax=Ferrimonas lipolytica TaxID=2724191 RepID=A0A6H1UD64_9GAMM|nr:sodium:proton antiporter [Ferrimonas lipolytica]QIZ76530.1 sodium:proton antiporter [Ferrimonas lipolytica]